MSSHTGYVTISSHSLKNMHLLAQFDFPANINSIGASAFLNDIDLTTLYIDKQCFEGFRGLATVLFPCGLNQIGNQIFEGCTHLETF